MEAVFVDVVSKLVGAVFADVSKIGRAVFSGGPVILAQLIFKVILNF